MARILGRWLAPLCLAGLVGLLAAAAGADAPTVVFATAIVVAYWRLESRV